MITKIAIRFFKLKLVQLVASDGSEMMPEIPLKLVMYYN